MIVSHSESNTKHTNTHCGLEAWSVHVEEPNRAATVGRDALTPQ
jgi:hypothetical protein